MPVPLVHRSQLVLPQPQTKKKSWSSLDKKWELTLSAGTPLAGIGFSSSSILNILEASETLDTTRSSALHVEDAHSD